MRTPLGLLSNSFASRSSAQVVVVPSLTNVRRFRLLSMQHRLSDAGIRALKQRGEGTSFSWTARLRARRRSAACSIGKSTARHRRLISREQSIERSQDGDLVDRLWASDDADWRDISRGSSTSCPPPSCWVTSRRAVATVSGCIAFDETVRAFVPPQRGRLRSARCARR